MRSAFNTPTRPTKVGAGTKTVLDETYDLRGMNLVDPDQIMPQGDAELAQNCRMYARDDGDSRVAIRTRKGTAKITTPLGETLDAQNVDTSTGDLDFSTTRIIAQPFTAGASGVLTRVAPHIKRVAASRGHILIQICANNGGVPGTVLAESSILSSAISTSYAYVDALFIDAPTIANGTQYWLLIFIQDNGSSSYYVNKTADSGALDLDSTDEGASWHTLGASFRFKSYLSTAKGVIGYHRRYPSNSENRTLFASNGHIYSAEDNGTVTSIDSSVDASAEFVRFDYMQDNSFWVDGVSNAKQWDGTTVSSLSGAPSGGKLIKVHQGRVFILTERTLWKFSDLYNQNSWPSVNFFYVPDPKSNDPVTGACTYQDNFLIFTHKTKHTVFGNDISTFTRKEAVGTKGAVSDEAIAVDKDYAYFMGDDGHIYAWNGARDILVSEKMEPEFSAIPDKTGVHLVLHRNQLRVYYQSAGFGYNNRRAVLDIEKSNFSKKDFRWFKDTPGPVIGGLVWNQDTGSPLIEFSALVGWMLRAEQGGSDLGKPIDFKYHTNYKIYGFGTAMKRVKRFVPTIRTIDADYTLYIGKDLDFQNDPDMREYIVSTGGAKFGAFVWGDGTKWGKKRLIQRRTGMSGRGRYIQYRFERDGVETPVELYGYVAQVKVGKPR